MPRCVPWWCGARGVVRGGVARVGGTRVHGGGAGRSIHGGHPWYGSGCGSSTASPLFPHCGYCTRLWLLYPAVATVPGCVTGPATVPGCVTGPATVPGCGKPTVPGCGKPTVHGCVHPWLTPAVVSPWLTPAVVPPWLPGPGLVSGGCHGLRICVHCVPGFVHHTKRHSVQNRPSGPK